MEKLQVSNSKLADLTGYSNAVGLMHTPFGGIAGTYYNYDATAFPSDFNKDAVINAIADPSISLSALKSAWLGAKKALDKATAQLKAAQLNNDTNTEYVVRDYVTNIGKLFTQLDPIYIARGVFVTVTPGASMVAPGTTKQFYASVNNTTNQGVTWSVNGKGTISSSGLYTAPLKPTKDVIVATSKEDPDMASSVSITVPSIQQMAQAASIASAPKLILSQPDASVISQEDTTISQGDTTANKVATFFKTTKGKVVAGATIAVAAIIVIKLVV